MKTLPIISNIEWLLPLALDRGVRCTVITDYVQNK